MADELAGFLDAPHDLTAALAEVVRMVAGLEQRLGSALFQDFLALHFSSNRPTDDEWTDHPLIVLVVAEIAPTCWRSSSPPHCGAWRPGKEVRRYVARGCATAAGVECHLRPGRVLVLDDEQHRDVLSRWIRHFRNFRPWPWNEAAP